MESEASLASILYFLLLGLEENTGTKLELQDKIEKIFLFEMNNEQASL